MLTSSVGREKKLDVVKDGVIERVIDCGKKGVRVEGEVERDCEKELEIVGGS